MAKKAAPKDAAATTENQDADGMEGLSLDTETAETTTALSTGNSTQAAREIATATQPKVSGQMAAFAGLDLGIDMTEMQALLNASNQAVDESAILVSRLRMAQSKTPEVESEQVQPKSFFDSISGEQYTQKIAPPWIPAGASPLQCCLFLPIFPLLTEHIKWPSKAERDAGMKNYHWKSVTPSDPRVVEGSWPPDGKWKGAKGEAPPVTKHFNIFGVMLRFDPNVPDYSIWGNPLITSFSRTSAPTGRRLITACTSHQVSNLPNFWGRAYWFYSETETKGSNSFQVWNFAKGPSIIDMYAGRPDMLKKVSDMAIYYMKKFTGPEGRANQEMYLSVAEATDEEGVVPPSEGGSGTDDDADF